MLLTGQEAIHEDPLRLMAPEPADVFGVDALLVGPADAHNELPQVAQVENVMQLGWRGQQFSKALIVELDAIFQHGRYPFLLRMVVEGDHEDSSKNPCESIFVEVGNRDDAEVPQEARSDIIIGCRHRVEKGKIDRVLEHLLFLLEVVEPTLVDQLPQEFYGWLGTVLLLHWHVKIVDEDDSLGDALGADEILPASFVQASLDLFLHLRASGP